MAAKDISEHMEQQSAQKKHAKSIRVIAVEKLRNELLDC